MKIHARHIEKAHAAVTPEALITMFQTALQIEHATIPPYLTALYSLAEGTNYEIHNVIESVVIEEMLHVTICANIINALGGNVSMTHAGFIPDYPCELPLGIADHLIVGLESFSLQLVHDVFMRIELPDHPMLQDEEPHHRLHNEKHHTLGLLYRLLQKNIGSLPEEILPGDPSKQVISTMMPSDLLFPVITRQDAIRAINIIIDQGEGSSHSPLDEQKDPGHYYRFAEVYHGRKIDDDPTCPDGYSYCGVQIPFTSEDVYPLCPNMKLSMLSEGSESHNAVILFIQEYQKLLADLEAVFVSNPRGLNHAIHNMRTLKTLAINVCKIPMDNQPGYHTGLVFVA